MAQTNEDLYQAIFRRKSVRKYDGELDESTMNEVRSFLTSLRPLFPGIRTELKLLGDDDVRGRFKASAPHFIAIFSEVKEGYEANAGFLLQQVDLFLSSKNVGSCWQGGPKPVREMRGDSDLEYVIMIAFGRPAEEVHRRSIAEFNRRSLAEISSVEGMGDIMEAARLAPSGINNQSWYFTGKNGVINAFSKKNLMFEQMNRVNVGIALCHMWLAATHNGGRVEFRIDSPAPVAPKGHSYVATMIVN